MTPGRRRAASTSTDMSRPCGRGLRRKAAWSIPGSWTSSTYRPRPVRRRSSSTRVTRAPMVRIPTPTSTASPPSLDELRWHRRHVDDLRQRSLDVETPGAVALGVPGVREDRERSLLNRLRDEDTGAVRLDRVDHVLGEVGPLGAPVLGHTRLTHILS